MSLVVRLLSQMRTSYAVRPAHTLKEVDGRLVIGEQLEEVIGTDGFGEFDVHSATLLFIVRMSFSTL